jgi:hypothetical protein
LTMLTHLDHFLPLPLLDLLCRRNRGQSFDRLTNLAATKQQRAYKDSIESTPICSNRRNIYVCTFDILVATYHQQSET